MIFVTAIDAQEVRLRDPVFFRNVTATRASLAGVVRRYGNKDAAVPRHLVVKLPSELAPTLIEDGAVQAGLLLYHLARLLDVAPGRPGHVPYLQILDANERVIGAGG